MKKVCKAYDKICIANEIIMPYIKYCVQNEVFKIEHFIN